MAACSVGFKTSLCYHDSSFYEETAKSKLDLSQAIIHHHKHYAGQDWKTYTYITRLIGEEGAMLSPTYGTPKPPGPLKTKRRSCVLK